MVTISIHQPNYLPYLGFFKKVMSSDIFVFLDDVQYEKNGFINRNKIRTSDGSMWLTIPEHSHIHSKINEVTIDNSSNWMEKHKKSIQLNYSKAKHFDMYYSMIELFYRKKYQYLVDINMEIIQKLFDELKISTKTILSSTLGVNTTGTKRILDICDSLDADIYLSGINGKNYLNKEDFEQKGIEIQFQNFQHPVYRQCYEPFTQNMSIIDLLLNEGTNSTKVLYDAVNF